MIEAHYLALRESATYAHSRVHVYIEANMSFITADEIVKRLQMNPKLLHFLEFARYDPGKSDRYGVWTSPHSKKAYAVGMQRFIPTLTFARELLSGAGEAEKLRTKLVEQFKNFREEIDPVQRGTSLFATVRYTGKSAGKCDDMVLSTQIAAFNMIRDVYDNDRMRDIESVSGKNVFCFGQEMPAAAAAA